MRAVGLMQHPRPLSDRRYVVSYHASGRDVCWEEFVTPVQALLGAIALMAEDFLDIRIRDTATGVERNTSDFARAYDLSIAFDAPHLRLRSARPGGLK